MSVLAATAATVAATPLPTPEVIVKTIQAAPLVPTNVLNLFNLLGLAAAGVLTSVVHLAIERGKLPGNVNRLLFTLYSVVAGAVMLVLTGQLHWDASAVVAGLTAFLAFLGSTQGQKMLMDFASKLINSTTTDPAGVAVPLATDDPNGAPA